MNKFQKLQLKFKKNLTLEPESNNLSIDQNDYEIIKNSIFFDECWYRESFFLPEQIDPISHYLEIGRSQGLQPSFLFDEKYYFDNNPDVEQSGFLGLTHFCLYGQFEGRQPSPKFDINYYVEKYPDSKESPLVHFLTRDDLSREEKLRGYTKPILKNYEHWLIDQYESAAKIEPKIALKNLESRLSINVISQLPNPRISKALSDLEKKLNNKKIDSLVFVPHMIQGGAEKVAGNILNGLKVLEPTETHLIIETKSKNHDQSSFQILSREIIYCGEILENLTETECNVVLYCMLTSISPKRIVNVNSDAIWHLYMRFGKALKERWPAFAALFCEDFSPEMHDVGYGTKYFVETFGNWTGYVSDNNQYVNNLISRHFPSRRKETKIFKIPQPIELNLHSQSSANSINERPRILWAGRIAFQKNPQIVLEIAASLPNLDFHVFGDGDKSLTELFKNSTHGNIYYHGGYTSFSECLKILPHALLYTSKFDGIPNVLIEAISSKLPVVSTNVGAILEILSDETAFIVSNPTSLEIYVNKLSELVSNYELAKNMASRAFQNLTKSHSEEKFLDSLRSLISLEQSGNSCE